MNREAFTKRYKKAQTKAVTLPDGEVQHVRAITPAERDAFDHFLNIVNQEREKNKEKIFDTFRARWLCLVLCDPEGNRLYAEGDVAELNALAGGADFEILFDEAWAFNGMSREAMAALKKSCANGTSNGSGSTSVLASESRTQSSSNPPKKAGASA